MGMPFHRHHEPQSMDVIDEQHELAEEIAGMGLVAARLLVCCEIQNW